MLICPQPQCKSENPGNHKFCQVCGTSLTHYTCAQCQTEVEFDAEACPQCQTPSGTYLLGIVSLASQIELTAEDWDDEEDDDVPITEIRFIDDNGEEVGLLTDPWHAEGAENSGDMRPSGDLGRSSGDLTAEAAALAVLEPPEVAAATPTPEPVATVPSNLSIYFDADERYRLLEPTAIELDRRRRVLQLRTIDRRPFAQTALECLMADEPITIGSSTISKQPETYRQWDFWNQNGIPRIAQAYIALRSLLSTSIPNIKDAWERDDKIFTLVEDRSGWIPLAIAWAKPEVSPTEIICWLDYTLKLWVALEPWQMRQSLLDLDNLIVDEDDIICLRSLQPESPNAELSIADLGKMWRDLFGRASIVPNPELILTIAAMANGELLRIEDIRSALQQQARDWGGEVTADISSTGDLTSEVTSSIPISRPLTRELLGVEDGAATHVGRKREHNEDFFGVITKLDRRHTMTGRSVAARGLYILCDGMGGHDGGEVASRMTVESLRHYFVDNWKETIPDEDMIRNAIISANQEVYDLNQSNSSSGNGRMGTTLVMVLLQDRTIAVAHVGDSRCYAITSSQGLIQLTLDHEVGQQEILRGVDPEIAYGRSNSYQLTQAIGPRDRNFVAPDISFFELQEDTLIVLASDGLTDNQLLETNWLTNVAPLMSSHADMQQGVDRLVDFANEYNGHDNITAIGVRVRIG
jgi:protein phosphatase